VIDEAPPDFRLLRFSTDRIARPERFDMWREVLTRKLLRVAIDPLSGEPFRAKVMMRAQHGFRLAVGEMGPTISRRTRGLVAADNDDLALMVNQGGAFTLVRPKGELTLDRGDAVLLSCAELGDIVRPAAGRQLCLRLPRGVVAAAFPDVEAMTGRHIPYSSDALALLVHYVMHLFDDDEIAMSPGASDLVVRHIGDLVNLMLGVARPAMVEASAGGLRAARLSRAKGLIGANLGREDLSAEDIAEAMGVSTRYVRRLFEHEGDSFSNYLATQRLLRAHTLLTSPAASHMSIATIAFEVGFGDLSYFNRRFRQLFGATPSDERAAGLALNRR
jgi:AraC-like DNA-binding protein